LIDLGDTTSHVYPWTSDWTEGTVSSVKEFGVFAIIWGHREILVRTKEIPNELLIYNNDLEENEPDRRKFKPEQKIKLKLKYLEADWNRPAKVTGSMKEQS